MEFLSRYAAQVREHLRGLSTSQWIAIVLCAVLVAVGVASLVQWSAQPERVPLLLEPLSAEQTGQIESQLRSLGADFEVTGDRILVRATDRARLLAQLQEARALPANLSITFAKLADGFNPFLPRDDAEWLRTRALESEIALVLSHFRGVKKASVLVNVPQRRRIGGESNRATASVSVELRSGHEMTKPLVESLAGFVASAVGHGLTPQAVSIVEAASGRSYAARDPESGFSSELLDRRREAEEYYAQRIREQLAYIPGVLVGVHAVLNLDRKSVVDTRLGPAVVSEEETITSSSTRLTDAAGPGVKPNVGKAVGGGGAGETTSQDESRTTFGGRRNETIINTVNTPGDVASLTASVNVPRSWFAAVYRQVNPQAAEPKDADLEAIIASETAKIRSAVRALLAAADTQVEVTWHYDGVAVAAASGVGGGVGAALAGAGGGAGALGLVRDYGPQAGLGLLALLSLAVVGRMLRGAQRSLAAATAPAAAPGRRATGQGPVGALEAGGDVVGEALPTEAVLEGREMNDAELRIRHIVGQIGQMVKEDSSTAVALVEGWALERQ